MSSSSEFFQSYAVGPIEPIGQGMEGAVVDLGGDLVGKTWFHRSAAEVRPLQAFLLELSSQRLPFRTPEIRAVGEVEDRAVSVEVKLAGTPLRDALESGLIGLPDALDLFVDLVTALGTTSAGEATKALAVIGESEPFWPPSSSTPPALVWGNALAELVMRRAAVGRPLLSADVDGFDELVERVVGRLREVVVEEPSIVHGDICQPNVLVGQAGEVALLDWGFLTTAGDNTFDAATAAGFFDMYGADAESLDAELLGRFEKLGHSPDRMHLYRVAYAIITATIYSPDARDGHYQWCLRDLTKFGPAIR
ncbi:phosphotransferase family protein [Kribbella monticola]|uniref:phosphotransferase family protein n=1 Tax=Kribbella monticola TaxID=2185285 RepID=UPI000DD2B92E|nr:phosphotransferase [Kribbella monticola]